MLSEIYIYIIGIFVSIVYAVVVKIVIVYQEFKFPHLWFNYSVLSQEEKHTMSSEYNFESNDEWTTKY